jgi:hypothetical protein
MNNTLTTTRGINMWREVCNHFDEVKQRRLSDSLLHQDHNIFPNPKSSKVKAKSAPAPSVTKLPDIFSHEGRQKQKVEIVKKEIVDSEDELPDIPNPTQRIQGIQSALDFTSRKVGVDTTKHVSSKNYGYNCYTSPTSSHLVKDVVSGSWDGTTRGHIGIHKIINEGRLVTLTKARQLKPLTPFESFDKQQPIALLY